MATELGKEHSLQDDSHCRLEQYRAAHTSSSILVHGYKFSFFKQYVHKIWLQIDISVYGYQDHEGGTRHSQYIQYLEATRSNRGTGAEQISEWWSSTSNRVTKMATEVGEKA
jgi:hypothetical protein